MSKTGSKIVESAKGLLGIPYKYGGTTTEGFDCSGLVQYVYSQNGYSLPRTAQEQYDNSSKVIQPQVGDLVFVGKGSDPLNKEITHVMLYIGDNKAIESPRTGLNVREVDLAIYDQKNLSYGSYLSSAQQNIYKTENVETAKEVEENGFINTIANKVFNTDEILSNIVVFITVLLVAVLAVVLFTKAFDLQIF